MEKEFIVIRIVKETYVVQAKTKEQAKKRIQYPSSISVVKETITEVKSK